MIIPAYLKPGDTVAIAAPARKISQQEIAPAVHLLQQAGFNVFYDDRLFAIENQFAGSDEVRANYLQSLLDNSEVKTIWCARGGYGSVKIIEKRLQRRFTNTLRNNFLVNADNILKFF